MAVHVGCCAAALLVPVCVLLDAGRGHHALPTGGEGVWNGGRKVVLPPHPGLG